MQKIIKIAFSGKKGVGKTTAAKYLQMNHGFRLESFAAKLKYQCRVIFDLTEEQLNGRLKETIDPRYDKTPREIMITHGAYMRYYDPMYWVKAIKINSGSVVIDDMRYINEAEYLKSKGYKLVRLNRLQKDNPYQTLSNDPSETQLDNYKFDYIIHDIQNTSLILLQQNLDFMIKKFSLDVE